MDMFIGTSLTTVDKLEKAKMKRTAARDSPTSQSAQRKKRKRASGTTALPPQPVAAINKLPLELRLQIIQYVTNDAFTLLNLLLVSKTWYITLTQGKLADTMWKDRCLNMGVKRKAALCRNWYATYVEALHKRCACCFRLVNKSYCIGSLLICGYKWMRVCRHYRCRPGPLQIRNVHCAASDHGLPVEFLITIPAREEYYAHRGEVKRLELDDTDPRSRFRLDRVLVASVAHMKLVLENKALELIEYSPVDKHLLVSAFAHSRSAADYPSRALNEALATLLLYENPTLWHYENVLSLYQAIRSTVNTVKIATKSEALSAIAATHLLLTKRESGWSWLDSMILGRVPISSFLAALKSKASK